LFSIRIRARTGLLSAVVLAATVGATTAGAAAAAPAIRLLLLVALEPFFLREVEFLPAVAGDYSIILDGLQPRHDLLHR
jgi:hypothetical protein